MRRLTIRKNNKGAVAPLVAIMLIVILVCVALVVDLGHIHNVKVQMQRAVDAAALAGAKQLPDGPYSEAALQVASANRVDNIKGVSESGEVPKWVTTATEVPWEVDDGFWDEEDLGAPADVRFVEDGSPINAVKVTASRKVDHVFFWFVSSTTVKTDAIAVSKPIKPTVPIAVTTCIPTGGENIPGVLSPGQNACDIALYTFGKATEDTAAWTSLTIENANSSNLDLFFDDDGQKLFNKIVFGDNEAHDGIENTEVTKDIDGCTTDDNLISVKDFDDLANEPTNITCGLGDDFPDAPESQPSETDPLNYNPLPRWYHETKIKEIWSMGDILTPDTETETNIDGSVNDNYHTRMEALKDASLNDDWASYNDNYDDINKDVPGELQDQRFDSYIEKDTPDFKAPLKEAGYPQVWLIEGQTETLGQFADIMTNGGDVFISDFRDINEPLDGTSTAPSGDGETVLLTIPIVFTGECSEAQYNKPGVYVGLANLLLTRIWDKGGNECFYNGEQSVVITGSTSSCDIPDGKIGKFGPNKKDYQLPDLGGLGGSQLVCSKGFGKSFEGLLRPPSRGEDDKDAAINKIYLVE